MANCYVLILLTSILLVQSCGRPSSSSVVQIGDIYGGQKVSELTDKQKSHFSSTVAIILGESRKLCSGVLVHPELVITSGHCLEMNGPGFDWFDEPEKIKVSALDRNEAGKSWRGFHGVSEVKVYPSYSSKIYSIHQKRELVQFDFAYLKLSRPLNSVTPVKIGSVATQKNLYQVGFGFRSNPYEEERNPDTFGVKYFIEVGLKKSDFFQWLIATKEGQGVAGGDSGGPVYQIVTGTPEVLALNKSLHSANSNFATPIAPYICWLEESSGIDLTKDKSCSDYFGVDLEKVNNELQSKDNPIEFESKRLSQLAKVAFFSNQTHRDLFKGVLIQELSKTEKPAYLAEVVELLCYLNVAKEDLFPYFEQLTKKIHPRLYLRLIERLSFWGEFNKPELNFLQKAMSTSDVGVRITSFIGIFNNYNYLGESKKLIVDSALQFLKDAGTEDEKLIFLKVVSRLNGLTEAEYKSLVQKIKILKTDKSEKVAAKAGSMID